MLKVQACFFQGHIDVCLRGLNNPTLAFVTTAEPTEAQLPLNLHLMHSLDTPLS